MTNAMFLEEQEPTAEASFDEGWTPRASSEDLRYGQVVIVTARWILIAAGLVVALWGPGPLGELRVQIAATLLLAGVNFYLHAQLLMRRPVLDGVVYAASIGDMVVITSIVAVQGGYDSGDYIFYYPAILAFAVTFPRPVVAVFAATTTLVYGVLAVGTAPLSITGSELVVLLVPRLLTFAAVAVCGTVYNHVETERRERALRAEEGVAR